MRGRFMVLLLAFGLQNSARADVLSLLPYDDAIVFKRCPTALTALEAENVDVDKDAEKARATKLKNDGVAVLCRSLLDLAVNAEKVVIALKDCRARGAIDAQSLIARMAKAAAQSRFSAEDFISKQTSCHRQP